MAENNDPWRRFRERQLDGKQGMSLTRQRATASGAIDKGAEALTTADLERMILEVESTLDKLGALYNQYLAGSEKRPPSEQRKRLGRTVELIANAPKAGTGIRFKCNNTVQRFHTLCERWDKQMRALENGELRRIAQEKDLKRLKKA